MCLAKYAMQSIDLCSVSSWSGFNGFFSNNVPERETAPFAEPYQGASRMICRKIVELVLSGYFPAMSVYAQGRYQMKRDDICSIRSAFVVPPVGIEG